MAAVWLWWSYMPFIFWVNPWPVRLGAHLARQAWGTLRSCLWLMLLLLFQELPDSLKEQTHLKEWYIHSTLIQIIPTYIELFQSMKILDLPKNQITCLPAEIGRFVDRNLRSLLAVSRQVAGHWQVTQCEHPISFSFCSSVFLSGLPVPRAAGSPWLCPLWDIKYHDLPHDSASIDIWQLLRKLKSYEWAILPERLLPGVVVHD